MAVKDKKLLATYGQATLDAGFLSIPNHLLENQKELNITDRELMFFIKVSYFFKKQYIRDRDLKMDSSKNTVKRIRKSLIEKGYLKVDVLYEKRDDGKIIGIGTKYDWSGLIEAMNKIPCRRDKEKTDDKVDELPKSQNDTSAPKSQNDTSEPKSQFGQAEPKIDQHDPNWDLHKVVKERTVKERTVKEDSSNSDPAILTETSQLEDHVNKVKKWYERNKNIFKDDLIPLWKKLYPKIAGEMTKIVEECYASLLTHPSNCSNYSAYFQKWVFNAACGLYKRPDDYDRRQDECLQWYIQHHPFGYSFNSEEDERNYIARVLAFIDQYPEKKKEYFESFQKLCEQYWKLNSSINPRFEYIEKSNWRLRHLPEAINYIIALNRKDQQGKKKKMAALSEHAPRSPGRYYASKDNGIFEVEVFKDDQGKLTTKYGPVDELKWQWSITPIDSS